MNASQPKYSRHDNVSIDIILYHPDLGQIPFTAVPGDGIFERAAAGEFGSVAIYDGKSAAQLALDMENAAAKAELEALDMASIRSMREWIAAQPSAPQILKDKDAAAAAVRARLK